MNQWNGWCLTPVIEGFPVCHVDAELGRQVAIQLVAQVGQRGAQPPSPS
jgi:hypothetical protein